MYHPVDTTHALEVVLAKILKTDLLQKVLLPSLDGSVDSDWNVTLLTYNRAEAASLGAGGHVGKSISQVVELAAVEQFLWHMVLQPQDFWNFHLDRHLSTNVSEKVVVGSIDLVCFFLWSVVEPENDVAVIAVSVVELWTGDGDWLVGIVGEDCEGAGGIETNTTDGGLVDVVLLHGTLDRVANASPDVGGGLLLYDCQSDVIPRV